MVKLKHPDPDYRGLGHGGVQYPMVDGIVEVPDTVVAAASELGYIPLTREELEALDRPSPPEPEKVEETTPPPPPVETSPPMTLDQLNDMTKKQLLAYCAENGVEVPSKANVAKLREVIAEYEGLSIE